MARRFVVGFGISLACLFAAGAARAQAPSQPSSELAVAKIYGTNNCSAFLVAPSKFLTAKHCVQFPSADESRLASVRLTVEHRDGRKTDVPVSNVWTAPGTWTNDFDIDGHDFAVLEVDASRTAGVEPFRVHSADPASLIGEDAELIGFGFHDGDYTRKVATTKIVEVGETIVVKPAIACPGDSGGVLVLTRTREAVGIASREWPIGSDPCLDPAKVTGYRTPEATHFQRIDRHAALIEGPPAPAPAPASTEDGCAIGRRPQAGGLAWGLGACFAIVARAIARRRTSPR